MVSYYLRPENILFAHSGKQSSKRHSPRLRRPVPYPLGHGGVYERRLNNECLLCSLYNNTFSLVKWENSGNYANFIRNLGKWFHII
jgi:hypothetical protein